MQYDASLFRNSILKYVRDSLIAVEKNSFFLYLFIKVEYLLSVHKMMLIDNEQYIQRYKL